MTMNLYDDKNAFWIESPYARVPRPSVRQPDGLILSTMEQMNRYELVQGTHSRSGEQLDTWQAVFSTVGRRRISQAHLQQAHRRDRSRSREVLEGTLRSQRHHAARLENSRPQTRR